MKRYLMICLLLQLSHSALADVVVPTKTIRANETITENDVAIKSINNDKAFTRSSDVIGQEARITLYAGRPILFDDVGPPALVARNQIVLLEYKSSGLLIATEGRSLQRGGIGDRIRVMNLDSRSTVFGQVQSDGSIRVKN